MTNGNHGKLTRSNGVRRVAAGLSCQGKSYKSFLSSHDLVLYYRGTTSILKLVASTFERCPADLGYAATGFAFCLNTLRAREVWY